MNIIFFFLFSYNPKALYNAIKKTNKMYHGLKNKTSRVIYLHGSADAWNILGLTKLQTKDSISIFIKGNHILLLLI